MEQKKEHNMEHNKHKTHTEHPKHQKRTTLSRSFYKKLFVLLSVALAIFAIYNLFQVSSFSTLFDQKLAEAKEDARPAEIELIVITANACEDCYDINAVIDVVESTGVNITKRKDIDFSSEEAKSIIDKYDIEKVPTIIMSGELDKSKSFTSKFKDAGEEKQDAYIFTEIVPPFIETSTGNIRGKISLIHLKKDDCSECFDLKPLIQQLSESGLKIKEEEIDVTSNKGKNLINKYDIKKVPVIIMDKEAEVYPNIVQSWNQLGSIENDGFFVARNTPPPYYSMNEEKIKGLVSLTIIADKSCSECYDAGGFHKPILQRFGVAINEEMKFDVTDDKAKSFISQYKIEKVPTIVLEGDAEEYPALIAAWAPVGTVESDGTYVFRKVEVAGQPYKDLTTGKIVEPASQS